MGDASQDRKKTKQKTQTNPTPQKKYPTTTPPERQQALSRGAANTAFSLVLMVGWSV